MMPSIAPELYTLLGVLGGGAVTGAFAYLGRRDESKTDRQKVKIDAAQTHIRSLQEQANTQAGQIRELRDEIRKIEEESRAARAEAWEVQDRARLTISMAAGYIALLQGHITARKPPPYPEIPADLERYIRALLWSAPIPAPETGSRSPPDEG